MTRRRVLGKALALLVFATALSGCGLPSLVPIPAWVDVHPQGWVVFTGARPPFPPPTPQSRYGDDKLWLFHPHLGLTVTLLEDPSESFSSPRWLAMPEGDYLFWVASQQKIYGMSVDFTKIEQMISEPLQSKLPFALQDAMLIWTEESGVIHAPSPSPDGRYLAFLREDERGFTVVVLGGGSTPMQKIVELTATRMSRIVWDSSGQAVFVVQEDPSGEISLGDIKTQIGRIVRHDLASGEERVVVDGVALYQGPPQGSRAGPGPLALSPDGQTLYYTTLTTLSPRTAQDVRLGLYSVELADGTRQLLAELPAAEVLQEIVVSRSGRRLAFTTASVRVGLGFAAHSALYLVEGAQVRLLAQQANGWLFPLWLDDVHLAYVQFQPEIKDEKFPMGVRPALWVQDVETGERSNYLPMLTMQMQLDALRVAVRRLQERVEALEKAVQELQAR